MKIKLFTRSIKVAPSQSTEKLSQKNHNQLPNSQNTHNNTQNHHIHLPTAISNNACKGASTKSTNENNQNGVSAKSTSYQQINCQSHQLLSQKYEDKKTTNSDEINEKYLQLIKPTDLIIFKSWYHVSSSTTSSHDFSGHGTILVSELIDRLVSYHILSPSSISSTNLISSSIISSSSPSPQTSISQQNDIEIFLNYSQLQLSDTIPLSKLLEILCETNLYQNKYQSHLTLNKSITKSMSLNENPTHQLTLSQPTNYPTSQLLGQKKDYSRAHTTMNESTPPPPSSSSSSAIPSPTHSSTNKFPKIGTIGKKDSMREFFQFAKQFSFDYSNDEKKNNQTNNKSDLSTPSRPMMRKQESIEEEQGDLNLTNHTKDRKFKYSQRTTSGSSRGGGVSGSFGGGGGGGGTDNEKSFTKRFFKRFLSKDYSTTPLPHTNNSYDQDEESFNGNGLNGDDDGDGYGDGDGDGEDQSRVRKGRSIASYFRRRDNNVDGAVKRISKVTIH